MIVNITGTNGAGKTSLVRRIMAQSRLERTITDKLGKPVGYLYANGALGTVGVVGRYTFGTPSGGCDNISSKAEVIETIKRVHAVADCTFFEGVIVSTSFGTYLNLMESLGGPFLFAILHPPFEICLQRIEARRAQSKRKSAPLNPQKVKDKWDYMGRVVARCKEAGAPHVVLDYKRPLKSLLLAIEDANSEGE